MKVMKKILVVALVFAMISTLTACGKTTKESTDTTGKTNETTASGTTTAPSKGEETMRFALIAAMTGDNAACGLQEQIGCQIAVDEINAKGGINGQKLVFDTFDDQNNSNQTVICAQKIAADGNYRFVIASNSSGCSQAAYPTLLGANLPFLSAVNTADFMTNKGFTMYLRACARDSIQKEQQCQLAIDRGYTKIAIFYTTAETDTTNYKAALEFFKEKGIEVVGSAQIDPSTEKDFSSAITTFRGAGADCVIFMCEYSPAALFIKQASALGWTDYGRIGSAGTSNSQLIEIAGDAAEGFISVASFCPDVTGNVSENKKNYVANYIKYANGALPGEWSAGNYDLICMLAEVLSNSEAADLEGQDLVDWIKANAVYKDGVMVDIDFDDNGDNTLAIVQPMIVKDKAFVALQ